MPLIHSGRKEDVGRNIAELIRSGRPHDQAIAIALDNARRFGAHRAAGGSTGAPSVPTYQTAAPSINASGFVPVSQVGSYGLDLNTGALTPAAQSALQAYAQRGLPIGNTQPVAQPAAAQPVTTPTIDNYEASLNGGGGPMKRGGALASGGTPPTPWFVRSEARGMDHPAGLVHTAGAGRTDNVPMSIAGGSHVIPADVVSGLGEGNSLAGAHAMTLATKSGPGGISLPKGPAKSTIPHPPAPPKFAKGGGVEWEGHPIKIAQGHVPEEHGGVKCIVAGGEWIMSPDEVKRVRHNGKISHEAIDEWILERRKELIHKLKKLPGPVKS